VRTILRHINLHRGSSPDSLMRTSIVVFEIPELQLVSPHFGIGESYDLEQFFIVGPMAPFHNAVLPRTTRFAFAMNQPQLGCQFLKGAFPLWMGAEPHGELVGVVGPDEKKGGKRSSARFRTPATVADFRSACISVYLSRVRK
jgi:hypothetical protein